MTVFRTERDLPPIAVLCGGLATRLRPLTTTIPKSMLEVAGEPFIAHQLRLLVGAGFREIVLLCGYLGEQIEEFAEDGRRFGCRLSYSYDGPELLGTGGAIRKALPLLGSEFVSIYGDSYCATGYRRIYESFRDSAQPALMTVYHNGNRWDLSNVEYRDGKIVRYDKTSRDERMTYIDYGINVFKAEVFATPSADAGFDLAGLQKQLVAEGKMAGLEVEERFYEIGSAAGLAETDALLRKNRNASKASRGDEEQAL
jgi:NDP-sugar pyrophosphorylase family protein